MKILILRYCRKYTAKSNQMVSNNNYYITCLLKTHLPKYLKNKLDKYVYETQSNKNICIV